MVVVVVLPLTEFVVEYLGIVDDDAVEESVEKIRRPRRRAVVDRAAWKYLLCPPRRPGGIEASGSMNFTSIWTR